MSWSLPWFTSLSDAVRACRRSISRVKPRRHCAAFSRIEALEARLGVRFPVDYKDFLRWSNGWDGNFGETWLVLDDIDSVIDANDEGFREGFAGYVAIGGNGGLETYALDYRSGPEPAAVVAIDRVSADADDIWRIAPSLTESLARLLAEPSGPWDRPPSS